jgi:lysophospholipase L1-like esterase
MTPEAPSTTGKTIGGTETMVRPPRRPRPALVNGFLLLVSLAVAFAGLELLFRFTGAEERLFPLVKVSGAPLKILYLPDAPPDLSTMDVNFPSSTVTYTYPDDPRGYFGGRNTLEIRINSWGFRGPEFEERKEKEVFRIAFLGDSFTLGQGVKFEDTYPQVVSAALNRRAAGTGVRFESYNFGVGGGNLINSMYVNGMYAAKVLPDMVVLGLTLNDMESPLFILEKTRGGLSPVRKTRDLDWFEQTGNRAEPGPKGWLATPRILYKAWMARQRSAKTVDYYKSLYGQGNYMWRELNLQALDAIARRCSGKRLPFRVLILPVFYRFDAYPFEEIHASLRGYLESRGIEYVDLLDSFRGMRYEDLWVHKVDAHPNEKAHAVIAHTVLEKVVDPVLLPQRLVP